jgi:hypothetical protein
MKFLPVPVPAHPASRNQHQIFLPPIFLPSSFPVGATAEVPIQNFKNAKNLIERCEIFAGTIQ